MVLGPATAQILARALPWSQLLPAWDDNYAHRKQAFSSTSLNANTTQLLDPFLHTFSAFPSYRRSVFKAQQQAQLISIGTKVVANNQGLVYPFFIIELKQEVHLELVTYRSQQTNTLGVPHPV